MHGTRGLATIEYILILVVLAIAAVAAWRALGMSSRAQTQQSSEALTTLDGTTRAGSGSMAPGAGGAIETGGAGGSTDPSGASAGGGSPAGAAGGGAGGAASPAGAGAAGAAGHGARPPAAHSAAVPDNSVYRNAQYEQDMRLFENRRMILWVIVGICVLLVLWIGVRNYFAWRKAKEDAKKRADQEAKMRSMDLSAFDLPIGEGGGWAETAGGGLSGPDTIPPPPPR